MPNYKPKGLETMRQLGRAGGKRSGEVRRKNAVDRRMLDLVAVWEIYRNQLTLAEAEEVAVRLPDLSGGSHDTDWRCPKCHQFHSTKKWICRHCGYMARKRRITRARLRELEAQHRIAGILRQHGLDYESSTAGSRSGPESVRRGATVPGADNFAGVTNRPPAIGIGAIAKLDLDRASA